MCYLFQNNFSDIYAYKCLDLPRRTHQKHLSMDSWVQIPGCKEISFSCFFCTVWIIFYCVCINAFSFPFKKKCRLTWFQILARSLIAGQLLHFSEPLKSAKGRIIIIATLQGCCGGLNKTSQAQGSPPRVAPSKCVGLVDYSHGTTYTKVDCSGGHQRSSDHVFRAPAIPLQLGETRKGFLAEAAFEKSFEDKEFYK